MRRHGPSRRPGPVLRWAIAAAAGFGGPCAVAAAGSASDDAVANLDLDKLVATRTRPLFAPSRHPPIPPRAVSAPAFVAPVAPRASAPDAVLTGIILGPTTRLAALKLTATNRTVALTEGGLLDGWTLVAIRPRMVVLSRDDETVTLGLRRTDASPD